MDFRGGVIADLGIPPPKLIQLNTPLCEVRELALDSSPAFPPKVPIFDGSSLVGYLTPLQLESTAADDERQLAYHHMQPVKSSKLSIDEPLELLYDVLISHDTVEVYDDSMKRLLAIVTMYDFARRYPNIISQS